MKCRLCDRPTATGAGKLCPDCAKALQRARGATLRKLATLEPEGAVSAAAVDSPPAVALGIVAAPPSRRPAVWVAISLAAIAILYAGQRELVRHRSANPQLVESAPAASTERSADEAPAVASRVEEPSWTTVGNPYPVAANGRPENDAPKPAASATAAKAGARGASSRNASQDSKIASPAVAFGDTPIAMPEQEPPPQPAKVSIAPPQPADGAQVLASAMERCGNESLLSKFVCEQKTYLAYCEDKWDNDPRCQRRTASSR